MHNIAKYSLTYAVNGKDRMKPFCSGKRFLLSIYVMVYEWYLRHHGVGLSLMGWDLMNLTRSFLSDITQGLDRGVCSDILYQPVKENMTIIRLQLAIGMRHPTTKKKKCILWQQQYYLHPILNSICKIVIPLEVYVHRCN